jgi:hypothetical protein
VWLVRLKDAKAEDEDKVFALKILRKVDGMEVLEALEAAIATPLIAMSQSSD